MSKLDIILAALAEYHAAETALLSSTTAETEDAAFGMVLATSDAIYDLAPEWFNAATKDGWLYGTGLAGDPSLWAPDEMTELRAMLAIGSL